jgi:SAM-dependent methyltransferase
MRALDIATGGGHTALRLATGGAWVVAGDLTYPMLRAARDHIAGQQPAGVVVFAQLDAEQLPFAAGTFNAVTCRIAPHHFPNVAQFAHECARALKPRGVVAIIDQLSPDDPKAADYVNAFERLRDPSHIWAYNESDWRDFFSAAGLEPEHFEAFDTRHDLTPWAERMGNDAQTITRLRVMLERAPDPVAAWMKPVFAADANFAIRQFLLVGRKPHR